MYSKVKVFYPGLCSADSAAVAITTTDLVSKSVAVEVKVNLYLSFAFFNYL